MRTKTLFIITLITALTSCKSFLKIPPIPEHSENVDQELKYIAKTDQKDRRSILMKVLFQPEEKYMKNHKILAVSDRDSIRLDRVIFLDEKNDIKSEKAKFHAGFIYLHGGGVKMVDDSLYLTRSSELFQDLMENATKKTIRKRAEIYYREAQDNLHWRYGID